jgi:carbon monoxide dehydrogenase subunit G
MELTNEFRVGVPVDEAWTVLTDVERIAPCLPGRSSPRSTVTGTPAT